MNTFVRAKIAVSVTSPECEASPEKHADRPMRRFWQHCFTVSARGKIAVIIISSQRRNFCPTSEEINPNP